MKQMEGKMKKLVEFVKEHKKGILLTAGGLLIGSIGVVGAVVKPAKANDASNTVQPIDIGKHSVMLNDDQCSKAVGKIMDCVHYEDGVDKLVIDNVKIDDLGSFGDFLSSVHDKRDDTRVWLQTVVYDANEHYINYVKP